MWFSQENIWNVWVGQDDGKPDATLTDDHGEALVVQEEPESEAQDGNAEQLESNMRTEQSHRTVWVRQNKRLRQQNND